jgi:hypothetical protein
MNEENAAVLFPHLELVSTEADANRFEVQFRQANLIILLGRPHSDGYERELQWRFDNEAKNYKTGYSVGYNVSQGKLVVTVTKSSRRISAFAVVIRFDNQIFGPRDNVNFEFKEAVSNALNLNAGPLNFPARATAMGSIGWTIGQPI